MEKVIESTISPVDNESNNADSINGRNESWESKEKLVVS